MPMKISYRDYLQKEEINKQLQEQILKLQEQIVSLEQKANQLVSIDDVVMSMKPREVIKEVAIEVNDPKLLKRLRSLEDENMKHKDLIFHLDSDLNEIQRNQDRLRLLAVNWEPQIKEAISDYLNKIKALLEDHTVDI